MKELERIPESFFGLFQSSNRLVYMEALMVIYEEYLYNDYFLSKDTCMQILGDHFNQQFVWFEEDNNVEYEKNQTVANRIFSKLIQFRWLRKVEDYTNFKTNIVIPDYASFFIETFRKIDEPDGNVTDLYIQNVYTNIYSFYFDKKAGIELLKTAMINTSNLNRALQDMLHNMDRFFESLLKQDSYEHLLKEHLYGYVEAIVDKKYGLLKTNDNFYIYKNDIKTLLRNIVEDEERIPLLLVKMKKEGKSEQQAQREIDEMIEGVERGIANMERRIAHIDKEHSKYVGATVRRLEYLLNNDENMTGHVIDLLQLIGRDTKGNTVKRAASAIQIQDTTILNENLLYKKRGRIKAFEETVEEERAVSDLSRDEVLFLNRKKTRYSREQIEHFITSHIKDNVFHLKDHPIKSDEEFELLVLAYDYSLRKKSPFFIETNEVEMLSTDKYTYPDLSFKSKGVTND